MISTVRHAEHRQGKGRQNTFLWFVLMGAFFAVVCWFVPEVPVPARPSSNYISSMMPAALGGTQADSGLPFKQPLVLCYHQIRDWTHADSRTAKTYILPVQQFREQMKLLNATGFHTILPDQWSDYLRHGTRLPEKSIILTFDDGTVSQYNNALPELDRYGFKAVFFIMTVTLDKPGYMSRKQVRYLADHGHMIGCHTWDHHKVTGYAEQDWLVQLDEPTRVLETITGKPAAYFAYPFGLWNTDAIAHLNARGYAGAFQLRGDTDPSAPLFTIRRTIADGYWNTTEFMKAIKSSMPTKP